MSEFIVQGKRKLKGEIRVNGAKNAAGPLLAATLLTDKECVLKNIPKISDVLGLIGILESLGKKIEWLDDKTLSLKGGDIDPEKLDFEQISKSRISVLLIGALIARFKSFKFARPGGDKIGLRPIDTHLNALEELGVEVETQGDFYFFKRKKLEGNLIIFPEFSVTATENLLLASVMAEGETILKGTAQEPYIQNLITMLRGMGAVIERIGSHSFKIKGKLELRGTEQKIIPDPNEAGTFLLMGAAAAEKIKVSDLIPEHLTIFLLKLKKMGIDFFQGENFIEISKPDKFRPVNIQALPYPGFATDLLPLTVPILTQAEGKSLIHDPLYENRLNFIHELRKMRADIEVVDPHRAIVFGKTPLQGMTIESRDIRAGASLLIAALMAEGESVIKKIDQIDRGHEKIEERLKKIGVDIKRV